MKNLVIAILCFALAPLSVFAAAVDAAGDVTLILPSDGSQYTLQKDASFESLTVNNATFVFSIAAGGSVELLSSDKKKLDNDLDPKAAITCETNQSRVFLSVPSGGSTQTVTVTPSGSCSTSSSQGGGNPSLGSSGGGGGGGGGSTGTGAAPSPAPVPTPTTEAVQKVAELKTEVTELQEAVAAKIAAQAGVSAVFTRKLYIGDTGDDVRRLQELLAADKEIYPQGLVTGYYGSLTADAIRRFQLKYGVISSPTDPGNGRFGPATRSKIEEVFAAAPAPTPAPAPVSTPTAPSSALFTSDLSFGARNNDVTRLQALLASDPEVYPDGQVTGYYGPLTQEAVRQFQLKYGVISSPADLGNGRVGPATRAKLAELFGTAPTPAPAPVPAPVPTSAGEPAPPAGAANEEERQAAIQTVREKIQEITAKLLQLQVKLLQEQIEAVKGAQ